MIYATLLKYAPYLAIAAVLMGFGGYVTHRWDTASYNRLQGQYSAYQAQIAQNQLAAQAAANAALQDQINARLSVEAHNAQVITALQSQVDDTAADRDRANRLLELAARENRSGTRPVSQTADQPGAAPAGQTAGPVNLAGLLVAVKDECVRNAGQLDALQAELKPQL